MIKEDSWILQKGLSMLLKFETQELETMMLTGEERNCCGLKLCKRDGWVDV